MAPNTSRINHNTCSIIRIMVVVVRGWGVGHLLEGAAAAAAHRNHTAATRPDMYTLI